MDLMNVQTKQIISFCPQALSTGHLTTLHVAESLMNNAFEIIWKVTLLIKFHVLSWNLPETLDNTTNNSTRIPRSSDRVRNPRPAE